MSSAPKLSVEQEHAQLFRGEKIDDRLELEGITEEE
jgi:hypothetical protein